LAVNSRQPSLTASLAPRQAGPEFDVIFDAHMHVGDFGPMFNVSLDQDRLAFTLPWSIEELAVAHPGVKVILGHMGHGNVVYINASIDVAARNPNVYLETSGMPMHTKIKEAVERVGAERVLYGSDVPFHHPAVEILRVQVSGLDPERPEQVLRTNARALFPGEAAPVEEATTGRRAG
jgi:predicted TIM-barrel fold metal-dependent hydrolase